MKIREVDKVEILTLQDNYIDVTALDNSSIIQRANPLKDMQIKNSILAEHGFSALVTVYAEGNASSLLFDFGFSEDGAARNAAMLGADMGSVKAVVLSTGIRTTPGGFICSVSHGGERGGLEFVCHPGVFMKPRYLKFGRGDQGLLPRVHQGYRAHRGVHPQGDHQSLPASGKQALFLGEIPRLTDFEKGFPIAHREEAGKEQWDAIEDDTGIAVNVKGKGLVVLTGCAHAGVVDTVRHAMKATGEDKVCAVMGGFHLSGPFFEPIIERTTQELKALNSALRGAHALHGPQRHHAHRA